MSNVLTCTRLSGAWIHSASSWIPPEQLLRCLETQKLPVTKLFLCYALRKVLYLQMTKNSGFFFLYGLFSTFFNLWPYIFACTCLSFIRCCFSLLSLLLFHLPVKKGEWRIKERKSIFPCVVEVKTTVIVLCILLRNSSYKQITLKWFPPPSPQKKKFRCSTNTVDKSWL